jgi:signal peptidase I
VPDHTFVDEAVDEDVVLRAFEAHASKADQETKEPEPPPAPDEFDGLLGENADDLVEDALATGPVGVSFAQLRGWSGPGNGAAPVDVDDDWTEADDATPPTPPASRRVALGDGGAIPSTADEDRKQKTRTLVRELVETGLLALLVFLAVRASFQNFKVDGNSMYPTLEDGQFLIVNKLVYSEVDVDKLSNFVPFISAGDDPTRHVFHPPERGDIVVLQDPGDPSIDLIKRVIGMPGDKLQIVDGAVYINDYRLDEPYITQTWHASLSPVLVPDGHYFVMGDNRDNSKDSRSSAIGFIPEELIIGKAEVSYWPFDSFGRAPNASPEITDEKLPAVAAHTAP